MTAWDLVTFDCYGTLVDWEGGIRAAFTAEAAARGVQPPDADALIHLYHEIEPEVEAGPFRPYREVLTVTAGRIAARLDWPSGDDAFLAESLPTWKPFPDTAAALAKMDAYGLRLGILSNVDRDLIAGTLRHFATPFEFLVTAQDVRSYKPALPHFHAAQDVAGPDRWVHAAQSWFHDIVPARQAGIPCVWVNRKAEPLGASVRPTGVVADLAGLAAWLEA